MNIAEKLSIVRQHMNAAAQSCDRDAASIKLIAVSKLQSITNIQAAYDAGQRAFGENYVQELRDKAAQLPSDIEWHLIGKLQRRNLKHLPSNCNWLETLDSIELAEAIEKRDLAPLSCLVQVNIGAEPSKNGVTPEQLIPFLQQLAPLKKIHLTGLMCIPPFDEVAEKSRSYFQQMGSLLQLANDAQIFSQQLTELSMGMSQDFAIAIQEGATIIRVGSAIFPTRPK